MSQGLPNQRTVAIVIESQEQQDQVEEYLSSKGFLGFLIDPYQKPKQDHYSWIVGAQLVYNSGKTYTNGNVALPADDILVVDSAEALVQAVEKYLV